MVANMSQPQSVNIPSVNKAQQNDVHIYIKYCVINPSSQIYVN